MYETYLLSSGMLHRMDVGVGAVVSALAERDMLSNSIIIFTSDNGGPAGGFDDNAASNFPLRGVRRLLLHLRERHILKLFLSYLSKFSVKMKRNCLVAPR